MRRKGTADTKLHMAQQKDWPMATVCQYVYPHYAIRQSRDERAFIDWLRLLHLLKALLIRMGKFPRYHRNYPWISQFPSPVWQHALGRII